MAERRIQEIQNMSRAMLVHVNNKWPQSITVQLWPFAMAYSETCLNTTPEKQQTTSTLRDKYSPKQEE